MGIEKVIGVVFVGVVAWLTGAAIGEAINNNRKENNLISIGPRGKRKRKRLGGRAIEKPKVFFSFHFDNDVFRTQQIRNIGAIHGNTHVTAQEWEQAKKTKGGVEKWIDDHMSDKDCVVVLVGTDTHVRPWVQHEIQKAWQDGKGLFGIYIHDIKCMKKGLCERGANPFDQFTIDDDGTLLSSVIPCYEPANDGAYKDISDNITAWVKEAITDVG